MSAPSPAPVLTILGDFDHVAEVLGGAVPADVVPSGPVALDVNIFGAA